MKSTTFRVRQTTRILAGSIAAFLAAHAARGASASWNVNADGAWAAGSNWTPAAAPGATLDTANADIATFGFTLTAPHAVTVDANRGIGGISFGNSSNFGFTLAGGTLLLNNAGVIQTLAGDVAHMETIASAIVIEGDGGSASFTANATDGNSFLNIGAVTGVSTGANSTTLNLNGANTGNNVVSGIVGNGSGGGKLAVTKSDAGTWQLDGANTYTGTTTIGGGTLVADSATALGNGGNITFTGGTLSFTTASAGQDWSTRFKNTVATGILLNTAGTNVTLGGVIDASNTAGLTKTGGGTLTLSGTNLYTGVTTIGGTMRSILSLNNAGALGGGGNITFSGGWLQSTANNTVDYSSRIVGSGSAVALDTNGQNVSFASALAADNTGGLTKIGAGDLTFGGNISQLYTGTTSVSGGRLILDNTGLGNNNSNRIDDGSTLSLNGAGTFLYKGSNQAATNSTETVAGINVGPGTLTVAFGGTNVATLTAFSLGNLNSTTALVNGTNLGKDTASLASVGRIIINSAPSLTGTTAALATGINSAAQDTQIVPFLVGEATAATGGAGTVSGVANTFVTWNASTGLRPLNPADEFSNNNISLAKNNRVTSATTAATTGAVNSLVISGANLTIANGVNLTNTSGAILFTSSNTIQTIGGASGFLFASASQQFMVAVNTGVNATISSTFTNTNPNSGGEGASIVKSGAGTLNLGGTSVLVVAGDSISGSRLVSEGGGTLNVTGVITAYAVGNFNKGAGTNLVGQQSAGNTLTVSGTGRLLAGGITIGGDIFGNNSVTISSPGNSVTPSYFVDGNGSQLNMGVSSSNNTFTVSHGAYVGSSNGGGANTWTFGTNAGANNNSLVVTGLGSTVDRNGAAGSAINVGAAGNGNSLTISNGGWVLPRRTGVATNGGSNNYILVTGFRSLISSTGDNGSRLELATGAGAQGNYLSVEAGATADWGGSASNVSPYNIGAVTGADNNYARVLGKDSLLTFSTFIPLTLGGRYSYPDRSTAATVVDSNARGNHLDVSDRATLVTNSLDLMGVQSAFNIGNGSGISRATVGVSTNGTYASSGLPSAPGVFLRSADATVNFNGGRLIAGAGGTLISGLGTVVLNGPAYVSTTQSDSSISTVISNGTANSLTKEGSGTLILSANNTYTGATVVTNGTLALDYTTVAGKLADASTLTLGGGTLDLRNAGSAYTEVVAATTLNAGRSGVTRSSGAAVLSMGGITPGVGMVNFGAGGIATTSTGNDGSDGGGILGPWATVTGNQWAANDGSGNVVAWTGTYSQDVVGALPSGVAKNVKMLNGGGAYSIGGATTINTLLDTDAAVSTLGLAGNALATNGVMSATGAGNLIINGGGSVSTKTAGANLVLNANSAMQIDSPVIANGASGLATAGAVTLNGVNTYTGNTGIGGTLTIGGSGQLAGGTYNGAVSLSVAGTLVMNSSANNALGGIISGDGAFTQSGSGTTTLSGANTYTGLTTVSNGVLAAGNATAFGDASRASLALSGSGKIQLNGNSITVIGLNGASSASIIESGSGVAGTDTLTLNAGYNTTGTLVNSSYSGILRDGGTRKLALVMNGPAALTLSGNNSYSGGTTVNLGSLTLASQTGLGTGTLTLAGGTLFQQSTFDGNVVGGAIPNVINLSGGQVFFNIPNTQKSIWLSQDVTGPGTIRLLSDIGTSGRTLTLSGPKTFTGGIIQTSGSVANNGAGATQHPSVQIDNVLSLGTGTFRAQINSVATTFGKFISNADLSAGVANNFEIAAGSRLLLTESTSANNLTLSGIISGNGNLIHIGPATLTLSGTNTYTGSTTMTTGVVSVSADASLGGANSLIFNGGTLQVTGTTMNDFGSHAPTFNATKTVTLDITNAANTFTVSQVLSQTSGALTKLGAGTLALSNADTYTGTTNVNGGVLLLNNATAIPGGINAAGGLSLIVFNGGVIGLGNGDFKRGIDNVTAGLKNVARFTGVNGGGWAAYGADRAVNIGGALAQVVWSDLNFGFNNKTVILGASTATNTVDLQNPINLGSTQNQTLQVNDGSAAIDAKLTGTITSSGGFGLIKTGAGTLDLNGLQQYNLLKTQAGVTNLNNTLGVSAGTGVLDANATTNITVSQDLLELNIGTVPLAGFGGGSGPMVGVVPEPGAMGLLLTGALGLLARRRRA